MSYTENSKIYYYYYLIIKTGMLKIHIFPFKFD